MVSKIEKTYNPKKVQEESILVSMQNLWSGCDIKVISLKTNWIRQWSLIIRQTDVKGWPPSFLK
jgi:hypothetical protein